MQDPYAELADTYDLTPPYTERQDVPFYQRYARACGGPVLELGCGTGRVLIPLAGEGVEVVGLDLSAAMLAICRVKLAGQAEAVRRRPHLVLADMARFAFRRRFGLILAPFRGFQHLAEMDDQLACLRCVARHLRPDGRFILDVFDPNYRMLAGPFPSEWVTDFDVTFAADGSRLIRRSRVLGHDKQRQVQHCEFAFALHKADGSVRNSAAQFRMRCLFRPEAEHLLARAGLEVEALFGDYDGSRYRPDRELIFVCRRGAWR